jgi:hypothetical protein
MYARVGRALAYRFFASRSISRTAYETHLGRKVLRPDATGRVRSADIARLSS